MKGTNGLQISGAGFHYRVSAVNGTGTSMPSAEYPLSRYGVIDFGTNLFPYQLTDSGYVLASGGGGYWRWYNGIAGPINPYPNPGDTKPYVTYGSYVTAIDDSGEVVGSAGVSYIGGIYTSQELVWPVGSSAPSPSTPITSVLYWDWDDDEVCSGAFDWVMGVAGGHIWSFRSMAGNYLPDWGYVSDLYEDGGEVGSVTAVPPPGGGYSLTNDYDPIYTAFYCANNAGQAFVSRNYDTNAYGASGGGTNETVLYPTSTTVNFAPVGMSNSALGHTWALGMTTNSPSVPIWWDSVSQSQHVVSDGMPAGINARTLDGQAAVQMFGTNAVGAPVLWEMNPATGVMGSAQSVADFLPVGQGWAGPGIAMVNDSGTIVGTAQYAGTNNGSGLHGVLLFGDTITRDGLPNTNNTVWVGQQINLTNVISGIPSSAITQYQWTVPGAAFKDYQPNYTNSCYTNLAPSDLTNSSCSFYWFDGATNRVVTCATTIYGQTNIVAATLNIMKPIAGINTTLTGFIFADSDYFYSTPTLPEWLHFGYDSLGRNPGITFQQTNSVPSGVGGDFIWTQIISTNNIQNTNASGTPSGFHSPAGVDTGYPYPGTQSPILAIDAPAVVLYSTNAFTSMNFGASMYLAWKASTNFTNGDKTVPVFLRGVDWSFDAYATNTGSSWTAHVQSYPSGLNDYLATNELMWTNNSTNFISN